MFIFVTLLIIEVIIKEITMNDNSALTPQEVADILKIAKNTVYELIKRGELNAYRVGKKVRVDAKDVDDYKNKKKASKAAVTLSAFKIKEQ